MNASVSGRVLALSAIVGVAGLAGEAMPASAQSPVGDFYRGKTINVLIGTVVGGEYDLHTRLVARFMGKHIPGNPNIVPQNMAGGGGIMMAKDKLLVGITRCNELDARDHCFIAGYEASTGKLLWKFYTVARKGTPGGDTWGNLTDDQRSGADAWIAGTYDPQLNLAFWGTGQAKGSSRDQRGPNGDALYSNTTLALDPDTGTLKWYFQNAPGETLDLDEVFERILVDIGDQKVSFSAGKAGVLWKIDRRTGKYIAHKEMVYQNVWDRIDPRTGVPSYRPEILDELSRHGLAPRPDTAPARLREQINDLYRFEIRALRDRCRAGEFSTRELPARVVELRRRYVLLSIPVARWTEP